MYVQKTTWALDTLYNVTQPLPMCLGTRKSICAPLLREPYVWKNEWIYSRQCVFGCVVFHIYGKFSINIVIMCVCAFSPSLSLENCQCIWWVYTSSMHARYVVGIVFRRYWAVKPNMNHCSIKSVICYNRNIGSRVICLKAIVLLHNAPVTPSWPMYMADSMTVPIASMLSSFFPHFLFSRSVFVLFSFVGLLIVYC